MPETLFRVVLTVDEDGWYTAECLDLRGCISQGKTEKEAIENIQDAIKGFVASMEKHGEAMPRFTRFPS